MMDLKLILLALGAGLVLLGGGRWIAWKRRAASYANWPSAESTIVSSGIRARTSVDDDNVQFEYWEPQVKYRYAVAGTSFEGNKVHWFDQPFRNRDDADQWLMSHLEGTAVRAFYDPARPAASALELNRPGSAPGSGLIWAGGAVMIGALFAN